MENIIQQLKDNEKPFGLMSEEMQEKASEIGRCANFKCLSGRTWASCTSKANIFDYDRTYRLRPDYEDEPEIVECEIWADDGHLHFRHRLGGGLQHSIHQACDHPDFIGFKFEDGQIWNSPINYSFGGTAPGFRTTVEIIETNGCVVQHATHVLFRRNKP